MKIQHASRHQNRFKIPLKNKQNQNADILDKHNRITFSI